MEVQPAAHFDEQDENRSRISSVPELDSSPSPGYTPEYEPQTPDKNAQPAATFDERRFALIEEHPVVVVDNDNYHYDGDWAEAWNAPD
jgi:hypothetical protein